MKISRRWAAFGGLCIGQALVSFNSSAITTVISSIARQFEASLSELQWVVNGYVLVAASFVMLGGKWGEKLGRRPVFMAGLSIFLLGSVLCALSLNTAMLFLGRFLQAIGAALILPSILALIEDFFEGGERKLAFGIWGAASGVSSALAIFVGGAMAQFLNWRWIFWLNIPFLLLALVLIGAFFPEKSARVSNRALRIDYAGLVALSLFSLGLIVAMDEIQVSGNLNALSAYFAFAAVFGLVSFIIIESRVKLPIMALSLFWNRRFMGGLIAILVINVAMYLILFEGNLFFQNRIGFAFSPFDAGIALLPMSLCSLASTLAIGRLGRWVSFEKLVLVGLLSALLGMMIMGLHADASYRMPLLVLALALAGLGVGLTSAPSAAIAMEALGAQFRSEAASFQMVVRYFGGALGVAVGASVYALSSADTLFKILQGSSVPLEEITAVDAVLVGASQTAPPLGTLLDPEHGAALKAAAQEALARGFANTMLAGALCVLCSLLLCLFLLRSTKSEPVHQ